jgi:beta-phosphoglucomutase
VTGIGARRSLDAIVFDFDGVLADTEPLHLRIFQETLARHGLTLDAAEYYQRYLGFDDRGVFQSLALDRNTGWTAADVADLVDEKTRSFRVVASSHPVVFDGVGRRLAEWRGQVRMAVASGALREEIEIILDIAGLAGFFTVIVAAGDTPAGKPAPDPYLAALKLLGASPSQSVAVEDSVWGIESARQAGMKVIAITTSYPRERLAAADTVVASFDDLRLSHFEELARR